MWAVECKNFGTDGEYFYMSGLTRQQAASLHANLSNSGDFAMCRSWDTIAKLEWERSKELDRQFAEILDGRGEGQPW